MKSCSFTILYFYEFQKGVIVRTVTKKKFIWLALCLFEWSKSGLADFVRMVLTLNDQPCYVLSDLTLTKTHCLLWWRINWRFQQKTLLRVWKSIFQLPFIIWRDLGSFSNSTDGSHILWWNGTSLIMFLHNFFAVTQWKGTVLG